jgi:hypothetical protein
MKTASMYCPIRRLSYMKSRSDRSGYSKSGGVTLIEAVIYIALVSCLMSGFIGYAYSIHEQNQSLFDDVEAVESS